MQIVEEQPPNIDIVALVFVQLCYACFSNRYYVGQ